ncbi:MAG TPA: DUF805 domain-containing protein [Sphingomicrobium sp.]|nr:DUF805 domain-containing protein [Sphingomicrobium sp.]
MTPIDWATRPLQKYADFTGRAPRAEYWWFVLLYMVGFVVATIIDSVLGLDAMALTYGPVTILFALAILVPSLAVGARRLHDTDRSGWWLLIGLIPLIGAIVLLVFFVSEGTRGANQYGDDPYAGAAGSAAAA